MTLAAGTRLGRYEIRSPLGAGGMGEVYLALDKELDRTVALKILPAELAANQQRMERFIQEAKSASGLNHPHIPAIYEIGSSPTVGEGSSTVAETRFIAMEFIDGETLRQRMRHGRLKLHDVLETAIQAASALAAAHAAGIIHRDIKPENIMVRRDGYIKLLDFGLAKLTEPPGTGADSEAPTKALVNTAAGTVMGTANYMSPEQAKGKRVDARADLWSLGAVIYEMVTGHVPFEAETPSEVIALILDKEPPPLARYDREAPPELERIVTKALTKDREERYQTAKDLGVDLRRLKHRLDLDAEIERTIPPEFRTSGSVAAASGVYEATTSAAHPAAGTASAEAIHQVSSAEYILTEIKRHRWGVAVVLGVFAIALVTGAYFLFFPRSARAIDSIAVLPLANAGGDPNADYLSDGISESLINNLTQVPKLRVLARSTVFRYKGKEVDPQKVGRELGVRAVLTGRVQQRGDNLVIQADLIDVSDGSELWGEQYNRSISDLVAVQQDIAREITTKLRLKLSGEEEKQLARRDTSNTEAYQLYLKGLYYWNKRTPDDLKKSIDYFQQAIDKDPGYALAYTGLADSYNVITSYGLAPPSDAYPKARAAARKALEIDDSLAEAHSALASCLASYDWDWPGAEHEFQRALQLNPNYATAHYFYAFEYLTPMGRLDEAIAEMKRAQELEPLSLIINTNYGATLTVARRYDEAIAQFHKALEVNPDFGVAKGKLSAAYAHKGKYDEAIAEGKRARELAPTNSLATFVLGYAYAVSGRRSEAQKVLDELRGQSKNSYVSPSLIGMMYAALGDKEQAFAWLEKAYEDREWSLPRIKVEPWCDPLRSDPRYADLLRRMGLPP